ncbi:MAG: HAD-IG family 5'-nucleotidase [Candidatus Krumholzibacteriota bacterium]|nr:HAD-IG family 5'-nucleotidase [Candidatus Krumholzibacteriota bacterium]
MSDTTRESVPDREAVHPHFYEQFIEKQHRIFVNRNLRMRSIRWVGFDMDHTLALYNRNFIEALAFDLSLQALVREKDYPRELLGIRYDPDFGIRGLVVDKEEGNILKMDRFHYVAVAYHGFRVLDKETRKGLYTSEPMQLSSPRFWSSDTLFGLPEIALYASVVEALEEMGWPPGLTYRQAFTDIRTCVDLVHKDDSLKSIFRERRGECFLSDPRLVATLDRFRTEGQRLFLLTNSDYEYTDWVLSWVMNDGERGRPWWSFFDLIVTDSHKPGFFHEGIPWKRLAIADHEVPSFSGGNVRLLEDHIGARGDEILYIGDHIFGDILRSKKSRGWRTVMVVEELEHEIRVGLATEEQRAVIDQLEMANSDLLARVARLRRRQERAAAVGAPGPGDAFSAEEKELESRLTRNLLRINELEEEIRRRYNPWWGSLCKVDGELSRFGDQMRDFACLYTARVSNFLYYPPKRYFLSPVEFLPHEI